MENLEEKQDKREDRNVQINPNTPEILTNNIYTPAFLREQIGKLMRVEFLIGTTNLTDRIGVLEDVGASYILLRSVESDNLIYCDIYSIKFITISSGRWYGSMNNNMMGGQLNSQLMNPSMMGNTMMDPTMMNNRYY